MSQKAATKRLEKVQNLKHGVTVGIGNVGFQTGEGRLVVQTPVKVVQSDFGILQLDFLIPFGNGHGLIAIGGGARVRAGAILRRNAVVIGSASRSGFALRRIVLLRLIHVHVARHPGRPRRVSDALDLFRRRRRTE